MENKYRPNVILSSISLAGKSDVHFFTQLKTVVQQLKELPRRRIPSRHPPTYETQTSCQGLSTPAMPSSSDISGLPYDNVSLSFAPSAEEDSPIPGPVLSATPIESVPLPSTSEQDPENQDPFTDRRIYTPLESDMIDLVASTAEKSTFLERL